MIAGAIILGVAALTPNNAQAQDEIHICASCGMFTAVCEEGGEGVNDVCVEDSWGAWIGAFRGAASGAIRGSRSTT